MKKGILYGLFFVLILTLLLSGCGGGSGGGGTNMPTPTPGDTNNPTPTPGDTDNPINPPYDLPDLSKILYRDMVSVSGGSFTQSAYVDVQPLQSFKHTISAFKMAKYEVTYELWYEVKKWATEHGYTFKNAGKEGSDGGTGTSPSSGGKYEPVTNINWRDAFVWCNAYSEMEGKTPVYYTQSDFGSDYVIKTSPDGNYKTIQDNPYVNWDANGYRLPTEGEWLYAASYIDGITWTDPNYASGATTNSEEANALVAVSGDTITKTAFVGTKNPNKLGIYDMSGNVYEFCWDWNVAFPVEEQTNYRGGTLGTGESGYRIKHGGYYYNTGETPSIGSRAGQALNTIIVHTGFRVARTKD